MGVEFTAMNPEDRGRLTGLLKPLLDKEGVPEPRV
jgi:hypothetical protein